MLQLAGVKFKLILDFVRNCWTILVIQDFLVYRFYSQNRSKCKEESRSPVRHKESHL